MLNTSAHFVFHSLNLRFSLLLQLRRQKPPQNLPSGRLRQRLQVEHTSSQLLIACQLAINPNSDSVEDFLLLTICKLCLVRSEAHVGQRHFGGLGIVVDGADGGVDYVWMAQEYVFEFRGGDLETM
jgi:hypothetical protein